MYNISTHFTVRVMQDYGNLLYHYIEFLLTAVASRRLLITTFPCRVHRTVVSFELIQALHMTRRPSRIYHREAKHKEFYIL